MNVQTLPTEFTLTDEPPDDPVLAILRNARDRYRKRACQGDYWMQSGAVCAIGSIYASDGFTRKSFCDRLLDVCLPDLSKEADEALKFLQRAADSLEKRSRSIATINDSCGKSRVLECFSYAIEKRKASINVDTSR